jgi:hypothetical protein
MKRFAVFQFDWPLQSHTLNFVEALALAGYEVDLLTKGCSADLVNLHRLDGLTSVRHIDLDAIPFVQNKLFSLFFGKLARFYEAFWLKLSFTALLIPVLFSTLRFLSTKKYDFLIGVEKKGLIWAGVVSRVKSIPFAYLSLELYDDYHPLVDSTPGYKALRTAEKYYHHRAMVTIIQDKVRGEHLLKSNDIASSSMIYFPISVNDESTYLPNTFLHDLFCLPRDIPVILYFGMISESRYSLEIANFARESVGRYTYVVHGFGDSVLLNRLREISRNTLIISTGLVSEDILSDLISSAHVGLALYEQNCPNDRHTAFSSEKIALYCRSGIPFVAFDSETYRELYQNTECCVLISRVEEVPVAVDKIMANYQQYKINARRAFDMYYNFELNCCDAIYKITGISAKYNG